MDRLTSREFQALLATLRILYGHPHPHRLRVRAPAGPASAHRCGPRGLRGGSRVPSGHSAPDGGDRSARLRPGRAAAIWECRAGTSHQGPRGPGMAGRGRATVGAGRAPRIPPGSVLQRVLPADGDRGPTPVFRPTVRPHRPGVEVLSWLAQGKTNPDIATILTIRPRTVAKHLERIFQKLAVETGTAAATACTGSA
jgi:Bacterial regulatory proteins, luxR family